jgi:DNA replication protein DnaC
MPAGCDTYTVTERGTGLLEMIEVCSLCDGSGLRILQEGGRQVAKPCGCRIQRRVARMLERARVPRRYEHCTLENYNILRGADKSQKTARLLANKFVESYPLHTGGKGLLLTGSIGVGKTHIAVGILKELIAKRGVVGLFYDYRELLKEVQNTYNRDVAATELGILKPVIDAEVLLLDELGAAKPTDWVWDTVAQILNSRYNEQRTTIITTNYDNAPGLVAGQNGNVDTIRRVMRDETLGDRIGERMLSRLQEMCVVVEVRGEDFRRQMAKASFGPASRDETGD